MEVVHNLECGDVCVLPQTHVSGETQSAPVRPATLFDVLGSGDHLNPLLAMLGPVSRKRVRCLTQSSARCVAVDTVHRAFMEATSRPPPRGYSARSMWGPAVTEEVTCPAIFTRSLLHRPDPFTPEPLRLLGLPRAASGDPGRYEVAEGIETLLALLGRGAGACAHSMAARADAFDAEAGRCALHFAALVGSESVAELLLDARASPNIGDVSGYTPLDVSLCHQQVDLTRMLKSRGAKIGSGRSVLRRGRCGGDVRSVQDVTCLQELAIEPDLQRRFPEEHLYFWHQNGARERALGPDRTLVGALPRPVCEMRGRDPVMPWGMVGDVSLARLGRGTYADNFLDLEVSVDSILCGQVKCRGCRCM